MRAWIIAAACLVSHADAVAQRAPIIDMHMHAMGVADEGPPPMAMRTPSLEFRAWDQSMARLRRPTCAGPVADQR